MKPELDRGTFDLRVGGVRIARVPIRWFIRIRLDGDFRRGTMRVISIPTWFGRLFGARPRCLPISVLS